MARWNPFTGTQCGTANPMALAAARQQAKQSQAPTKEHQERRAKLAALTTERKRG